MKQNKTWQYVGALDVIIYLMMLGVIAVLVHYFFLVMPTFEISGETITLLTMKNGEVSPRQVLTHPFFWVCLFVLFCILIISAVLVGNIRDDVEKYREEIKNKKKPRNAYSR